MKTATPTRWYKRRAGRIVLAAAFLSSGVGAQLATASTAQAEPRVHHIGDGWFCSELPSWPYFYCYN